MIKEVKKDDISPFVSYIEYYEENKIIGTLKYSTIYDRIEIDNIFVEENYRRKGIGNKLLIELINLAKNRNKNEIILEVNDKNEAAIKLYEKNGFKNIGIRKKYYNNTHDANIMSLSLK